jgi:hypothetical protein
MVAMGVTEIELGRSDGSDLPADVLAQLEERDLPLARLADVICRLLSSLSDVERVERLNDESIDAYFKGHRHPLQIFLGNLHRLLMRGGIEARAKELNRFMRGQRESMGLDQPADLAQLRLVVKDERFLSNLRQQVPDMKPLVRRRLAGDLWLVCVWDAPNGMRFATENEAGEYELSVEQMLQRAKANFLDNRPPVELTEHGCLLVAQTRDCYDATLLIDVGWWDEIQERISGDVLACVPARHVVLIGGTSRRETVPQMREAARRIEAGGDHLISGTILIRREAKWEVLTDEPAGSSDSPMAEPASAPPAPVKRRWWRFW